MKKIKVKVVKKAVESVKPKKEIVEDFSSSSENNMLHATLTITDGKISYVAYIQDGGGGGGYSASPGDSNFMSCRYDVFTLMARYDTEKFKAILKKIKDSDPENYDYGVNTLESEKEDLIIEASKFDL